MNVALKFMIILQNLTTTNQRKSGEGIYVRKLTKLDVVTARIRYRVNGVSDYENCCVPTLDSVTYVNSWNEMYRITGI